MESVGYNFVTQKSTFPNNPVRHAPYMATQKPLASSFSSFLLLDRCISVDIIGHIGTVLL